MRIRRTFNDLFALVNHLTIMNQNVLVFGDQELVLLTIQISNDQTLLALGILTKADRAGMLGKNRCILRRARFKQFGNTRQTACNVTSLGRFLWHTCKDVSNTNLLTIDHRND